MIRIRDIALPPEHNVHQLNYEAAQLLKVSVSKIRQVKIVRRSVDARKKPDVKIIYTIEVAVEGNEGYLCSAGRTFMRRIWLWSGERSSPSWINHSSERTR